MNPNDVAVILNSVADLFEKSRHASFTPHEVAEALRSIGKALLSETPSIPIDQIPS